MGSTGPDRIVLVEQKLDVIAREFNQVLGDIEKTVGLLTKGTAEALKSLKLDIMHLEAAMEKVYEKLPMDTGSELALEQSVEEITK